MNRTKTNLTAAAIALALAGFGAAGAASYAGAQDPSTERPTVTPEVTEDADSTQSDDSSEGDESTAKGEHTHEGRGHRGASEIAELLGVTAEELHDARAEGLSLADVAEANGVDVQVVIDAMVEKLNERVDMGVERGRITETEADELRAQVEDHVTARVNGEDVERLEGLGRGKGGRGGHGGMRGDA